MSEVNAITVDAALTELRGRLGTAGDRLLHLVDLITFTEEQVAHLRPRHHAASFVLEVLGLYDRLLSEPFDPAGLNPRLLEQASTTLGDLESTPGGPDGLHDRGSQVRERLGTLAASQFTLVGRFEDAIRVLDLERADVSKEPGTLEDGPTWLRGLLDYRLRPIAVGTDDPFDEAWERAFEDGVVDAPLDNDFKINLMERIEMWTANGWEPVPLSESANVPTALLNAVD